MKRKIVADSSANLLTLEGVDFESVPLKILTDQKEYVDDATLDVEEMIRDLSVYKGRSGTACPGVGDWLESFGDYDEVFCLTIYGVLSGSYNSAMAAKKLYEEENPGKRVFVMDTIATGAEMKLLTYKIKEMILAGEDFETICEGVQSYKKHTSLIFCLESLRNLANNGRVKPAVATLASIVGLRLVGCAGPEGLNPTDKCRGEKKALSTIYNNMKTVGYKGARVIIDHCYNEKAAAALKSIINADFPGARIDIQPTRGLCSFYAEKGGMIIGFEVN